MEQEVQKQKGSATPSDDGKLDSAALLARSFGKGRATMG